MTFITNIRNRFFLNGAYVKDYAGPLRIIEFAGPPGVGKCYLFRELIRTGFCFSKAIPRIATGLGPYYIMLDHVRKDLLLGAKDPLKEFIRKRITLIKAFVWVKDCGYSMNILPNIAQINLQNYLSTRTH